MLLDGSLITICYCTCCSLIVGKLGYWLTIAVAVTNLNLTMVRDISVCVCNWCGRSNGQETAVRKVVLCLFFVCLCVCFVCFQQLALECTFSIQFLVSQKLHIWSLFEHKRKTIVVLFTKLTFIHPLNFNTVCFFLNKLKNMAWHF